MRVAGRAPRYRHARVLCPSCGREVAGFVPRHGDGSAVRPVWHLGALGGTPCAGRFDLVDIRDAIRDAAGWRP